MAQGIDPGEINAMRKKAKAQEFEVWEENWEIVMIFMRLQTQWNVSMSGVIGLNYQSLEYLSRLYSVEDVVSLFEGVQTMELVALASFNKKES